MLVPGKPDQVLMEPTSGNTGIGLAMVCRVKGYHLKVVMPTNVSVERRQLLEVWGAEIIESPGPEGSNGAVRMAQRLAAEHPEWVFLYQYGNPANPKAHYEGTGPEILRDCPGITHFVAGLGTSGTLLGVGRFLREKLGDAVQIWAVEPPAGEMVDGLRNLDDGYIPPIFEELGGAELLDRKTVVRPRESIEWTRRLTEVGVFAGISTGAALAGAVKCAASLSPASRRRSSSSPPTAAGSTSRPGPGRTTSTRSPSGPSRSFTSEGQAGSGGDVGRFVQVDVAVVVVVAVGRRREDDVDGDTAFG